MIARCGTCPFWKRSIKTNSQNAQSTFGVCQRASEYGENGMWAGYQDTPDETHPLEIVTAMAFGCVCHPGNKAIA